MMHVRDHSFSLPYENLAYDEILLQLADKHHAGEFLRFWESPVYFIVLGRIGRADIDVNLKACQAEQIPVLRRSSGGGTVVQGRGCLNYTLVLSKIRNPILNDLRASYAWISAKVIDVLAQQGINAQFCPISDLATLDEKKFSGNAQHRGKNYVLHHGTILYDFNLTLITQYLQMPVDMPDYRRNRPHTDFVTNIALNTGLFKQALPKAFGFPANPKPIEDNELLALKEHCLKHSFLVV